MGKCVNQGRHARIGGWGEEGESTNEAGGKRQEGPVELAHVANLQLHAGRRSKRAEGEGQSRYRCFGAVPYGYKRAAVRITQEYAPIAEAIAGPHRVNGSPDAAGCTRKTQQLGPSTRPQTACWMETGGSGVRPLGAADVQTTGGCGWRPGVLTVSRLATATHPEPV